MKQSISLLFVMLAAASLFGQTDRGTITGTVSDPSSRRIAGAQLMIKSLATGVETPSRTNGVGVYVVTGLPTGLYQVTVEAEGFTGLRFESVSLDVGQIRTLDAKLSVFGGTAEIDVQPDSGLSKSSGEIGGVVYGQQATDLPIDGRSFIGLISLIPGAIDSGTGQGQDVRFAGLSDEDNTWHLDGVDNSGINNSFVDVNLRLQVSTESIAEFRANSVAYSADQGGTPGGQIEVSSKTGGDRFRGSVWEFLRNSVFDAAPYGAKSLPPLHMNDYGANLGGPVLKSRLFFFANYEASRQNLNPPLTAVVPSASYRQQVATQQPVLAPLIETYPLGTTSINSFSEQWYGSGLQVTNEDSALARVDWHATDKLSAFLRYSTDHFRQSKPDGFNPWTAFHNENEPSAVFDVQYTFSPTLLNDFKYGFNRTESLEGQTTPFAFSLSISPFTSIGNSSGTTRYDNSFSFIDNVTMQRGRNTIKWGVEYFRQQENKASPNSPDWEFTYNDYNAFLLNQMNTDYYRGANPLTGARLGEFFGYVLDDFKITPTLSANVGLRYEYFGVDHEVLGRGVNVDPYNCPNVICPAGTPWYYPNTLDLSPRVSLAWSPEFTHGKLAIRAGYGIYYGNGQFGSLGDPIGNISTDYTLNQINDPTLSFPISVNAGIAGAGSPTASDIHRKDTGAQEWTLSIQQEVARQTVFQLAYFGTGVDHTMSDYNINGINPATGVKPFPGYSTIEYKGFQSHASTNAMQASLQRSFSNGLLFTANYEWSHSIDNGGIGGGESSGRQDEFCGTCERSSSSQDMRNYFTASTVWKLPVGRGRAYLGNISRAADQFVGGWQLSAVADARSGLPLNVTMSRPASALPDQLNGSQRPNRVPGVPLYPANRSPNNWLNPAAFATPANGTWGDLGRNAVNAPGIWQLDPALNKRFPITERVGLNLRAEAFNVFNIAQYGSPAVKWAPATSTSANPNNYGVITSSHNSNPTGSGTPRELQFSFKMDF